MNVNEQNLYQHFTKSAIDNFEDFINRLDKCSSLPSDAGMILKMRSISQKMQRLISKWDGYSERLPLKRRHSPLENSNPASENGDAGDDDEDDLRELDHIQATRVGDKSFVKIEPKSESISETVSVDKMDVGTVDSTTKNLTLEEREVIRRFKNESVQEAWVAGPKGMFIKEYAPNLWRCDPCKKDGLSAANIVTHVSGKLHLRKVAEDPTHIAKLLIDSSLPEPTTLSITGALEGNVIQKFNGYVCVVCDTRINSEESLKSHLKGSKHIKNCLQANTSAAAIF